MFHYLEAIFITLVGCLVFVLKAESGLACDDECQLNFPNIDAMGRLGNYCYEFVNQTGSWYDAKDDCQSRNGTLTDIHSTSENYALIVFLTKLGVIAVHKYLWIGVIEAKDGGYYWASSADFDYFNWYPGPTYAVESPSPLSAYCGIMDKGYGQWFLTSCNSQSVYGWICKYNIN